MSLQLHPLLAEQLHDTNPLCVQANRMADALLIADLAGRDDLTRVQQLYMKKQPSPYMRVVKAIQGNDFVSKCLALQLLHGSDVLQMPAVCPHPQYSPFVLCVLCQKSNKGDSAPP